MKQCYFGKVLDGLEEIDFSEHDMFKRWSGTTITIGKIIKVQGWKPILEYFEYDYIKLRTFIKEHTQRQNINRWLKNAKKYELLSRKIK